MLYYLETSALVKLYVRERGSEQMLGLATGSETNQLAILAVAQPEFHSAVRRRQRTGDLDGPTASELLGRFDLHLRTRFLRQSMTDPVLDLACRLVEFHPLRAYDAVQLAGCLILRTAAPEAPVFVSADQQLLQAAETEGLMLLDPAT